VNSSSKLETSSGFFCKTEIRKTIEDKKTHDMGHELGTHLLLQQLVPFPVDVLQSREINDRIHKKEALTLKKRCVLTSSASRSPAPNRFSGFFLIN
jgi:hypothetical protein